MKLLTGILVAALIGTIIASSAWFPVVPRIGWDGLWGDWGLEEICYQTYANKFKVRTERHSSDNDDTALNSVCIICTNGRELCSKLGFWGDWYSSGTCTAGFTGGKYRFEKHIDGDDTAGNTVLLRCGSGNNYYKASGAPDQWGSWSSRDCPHGTKICGIQTRVEDHSDDNDDTALNGIKFACCATVVRVDAYLKTIYHGEGGSGSSSYVMISRTVETGISTTNQMDITEQASIAVHVGMSVSYGAVSGDASIDASYLKETFKSTISTKSKKVTETKEFKIFLNEPTYIYQARSTIVLSDGSTLEQGSPYIMQRSSPILNKYFTLYNEQ